MLKSRSFIAIPPGATIKEQLQDRGFRQIDFAFLMGMRERDFGKLLNGDALLTHDIALRLEMILGIPANFWDKLETIYRGKLIKVKAENKISAAK